MMSNTIVDRSTLEQYFDELMGIAVACILESFHNLVENSKMGLIFTILGMRETLRISAKASIMIAQAVFKFARVGKHPAKIGLLI